MADIEVFGIGLDTSSAVRNAKNLEKSLLDVSKSSGKVAQSGESMASAMLKSQIAFAALSKATSFLTDQLKQSVTVGAGFEQQMAKVGAVSKASAEQQKALSEAAKEMGRTTQFSATQAAEALEAMSRAGFKAQQSIAALPKVLQLSAASGVSLGESADIVTNIMSSMGKQVSDLSHVNNVLVETFTSSNTTLESLASSISYAGGIAATTGVSFEQLNGLLGIFGNAGVSGTRAGTALRQAMATLIDPTKKAADTLKSLNVEVGQNLVETLKELERAGASSKDMIAIFGTEAGGALLTLKQAGGIQAVEDMAQQLRNVGDVADEIATKQMDTLQGSFTKLSSAVEGVRISIFEDLIRDDLKTFIDGLTTSIEENEESFRAVVRVSSILIDQLIVFGKTVFASSKDVKELTGSNDLLVDSFTFFSKVIITLTEGFTTFGKTIGMTASSLFDLSGAVFDFLSGNFKSSMDKLDLSFRGFDDIVNINKESLNNLIKKHEELDRAGTVQTKTTKEQKSSVEELDTALKNSTQTTQDLTNKKQEEKEKTKELNAENEKAVNTIRALTQAQQQQEQATNKTTQAIQQQTQAQEQQQETARRATRIAGFSTTGFGSSASDYLRQYGFTIERPAARTQPQTPIQTYQAPASFQSTSASSNLSSLLSRYERLSEQISNFMTRDVSLDIKLADAQEQLKNLSIELASLNEGQLQERIELSERYFATIKDIDQINKSIANEQKAALKEQQKGAEGIGNILDSVLADLNELTTGDISKALPVEKLQALKLQFEATSTAIDNIDFSEITSADKQLIAQFQNVSGEFLNQASEVFKSSENYQVIKDSVKGEFDDLAKKLVDAMADADPSTFEANLNKLKTSFGFLDTTTKTLTTSTDNLKTSADATSTKLSGESALDSSITSVGSASVSTGSKLSGEFALDSSITSVGSASTSTSTNLSGGSSLTTSLVSLGLQANNTTTKTSSFKDTVLALEAKITNASTAASGMKTGLDNLSKTTLEADSQVFGLDSSLRDTTSPFEATSSNIDFITNKLDKAIAYLGTQSAALLTAITTSGGTLPTAGGGATGGTIAKPEPTFVKYFRERSGTNDYLYAEFSDGSIEYITSVTRTFTNPTDGIYVGTDTSTAYVKRKEGVEWLYSLYRNGDFWRTSSSLPSGYNYAKGAWDINDTTQRAILHRGEMVIREDDAPMVRNFLSSTGASSKYGAATNEMPDYDTARTIELLADILSVLKNQKNPAVFLNARKVSEELQRYQGLSA